MKNQRSAQTLPTVSNLKKDIYCIRLLAEQAVFFTCIPQDVVTAQEIFGENGVVTYTLPPIQEEITYDYETERQSHVIYLGDILKKYNAAFS